MFGSLSKRIVYGSATSLLASSFWSLQPRSDPSNHSLFTGWPSVTCVRRSIPGSSRCCDCVPIGIIRFPIRLRLSGAYSTAASQDDNRDLIYLRHSFVFLSSRSVIQRCRLSVSQANSNEKRKSSKRVASLAPHCLYCAFLWWTGNGHLIPDVEYQVCVTSVDMNSWLIIAVIHTDLASCEIKAWKNFRPERDSNPWPLR